jgi:ribonuclease HII
VVLIDGKFLNLKNFTCISIVKGDMNVFSIAAASILAKTSRDALMHGYAQEFPNYFFERNKGYLTPQHLEAIRSHGFSPLHRKSFSITL